MSLDFGKSEVSRWILGFWLVALIGCSATPVHPPVQSSGVVVWQQHKASIPADLDRQIRASYLRLQQASGSHLPLDIVADPNPNAFASVDKNGVARVRLNVGLIDMVGYDQAAMAFVLAHEIGHIELDQLSDNHRQSIADQDTTAELLGTVADLILPLSSLVVLAGNEMIKAGYSRDQEREADQYGIELMVRVGFDPQGAVRFQQQLQRLSTDRGLGILATHPSSDERVENLQRYIDRLANSSR
ncbi:MAG: M48 family metallopeptidase [Halopseudomonas sp.]